MERREFIRLCAAGATLFAAGAAQARFYSRAMLVDERGAPLRAAAVPPEHNLIFNYPYAATPCFLLNLGRPAPAAVRLVTADGHGYEWQGGVGPGRSLVAYSAICAHKMTYPTRQISFISYRAEASGPNRSAHVIHCCSEHSQYDPASGGKVLAGPAPQPLAAILLEHDAARDALYAVGTLGGEMFDAFFAKYAFRLALEYGPAAQRAAGGTVTVFPLEDYCRQQVQC